jgi:hypothetical protein
LEFPQTPAPRRYLWALKTSYKTSYRLDAPESTLLISLLKIEPKSWYDSPWERHDSAKSKACVGWLAPKFPACSRAAWRTSNPHPQKQLMHVVTEACRCSAGAGREAGSASPMHYKTRELKRSAQAVLAAFSFLMGPDSSVGPRFEPWCRHHPVFRNPQLTAR